MKNYTITVNGVAYDVTVEETAAGAAPVAAPAAPKKAAPAAYALKQAQPEKSSRSKRKSEMQLRRAIQSSSSKR